ncbi:centrosomal protein of 89 kDa [Xenopus laevis]|uniref:Centrosomal protein of 89 kDa n=2 Tax=Xenopus laevis TaxID=8355 RepID=A0A974HNG0_XENLA|nr:centrosomal protein of 89 kDa [Xenopus laevis]OCT84587.1 hypothetical protein XELAEV_18022740mg [Xenopus laevis]
MSFPFRRRSRNEFKHIAHGLIPAATVAPRSAVPRTPPPRSPNPSPERPRSALAAAILMTSLTGRTVAIPQPRQRSYSENDSTYIEESSTIDPYATARDLGLEQNWKEYGARQNIVSPVMSSDFDDEGTDEEMSDIEREHAVNISEKKVEMLSHEPIYSLPIKNKKESILPLIANELSSQRADLLNSPALSGPEEQEEESINGIGDPSASPSPPPPTKQISKRPLGQNQKAEIEKKPNKETIEPDGGHILIKGPAIPSVCEAEQLRARNLYLSDENQALSDKLQELKQQIKAMRIKLKEVKNEKRDLSQSMKKQQTEADAAELASLREQAQELVDENDALKTTVYRLNVELSRYQTKFRPLLKEEKVKLGSLPQKGPPPPWLLDMKYLSPLLLAYEDRMREKDDLIISFEEEVKNFKTRVKKVVEENKQLHRELQGNRAISNPEWQLIQAQARLVLEENQTLMEQLQLEQSKAKETERNHLMEISRLTKQMTVLEGKNKNQEEDLLELQKQQEVSRSKYDELRTNMEGRIAAEEHVAMVNELKSQMQHKQDTSKIEEKDLMDKIATLQLQKKSLLLERNDLLADNKILDAEVETVKKSNRKLQRKLGQLKQQLEDALEKEVAAHQYLANIITLAENISLERDELMQVAKSLKSEKQSFFNKMLEGNVRLGKLEELVKVYKKKAAGKLQDISHRLSEQEEDFAGKAVQYQREMRHLQRLLQDRQETLDEVLQQKRQVEGELEVIWESTSNENKQMKELLHNALMHNKWNTSETSQVFQHSPVNEFGFAYCDVNASPREDDPIK